MNFYIFKQRFHLPIKHRFISKIIIFFSTSFLLFLIFQWIFTENVTKYEEQCKKYPNSLLKELSEKQHSFMDIEANLKDLNLEIGGIHFAKNKSNLFIFFIVLIYFILILFKLFSEYFSDTEKLAIVVPYRDRLDNLKIFIEYMHIFLSNQDLTYQIILVEPEASRVFNRGLLLNIGYKEALKIMEFDCFILHDVDMVPENPDSRYVCNENYPTQMAIAVSIYKYL